VAKERKRLATATWLSDSIGEIWGVKEGPHPSLYGVMLSRHSPRRVPRVPRVVPMPHSGTTSHVRDARWHRARQGSNDGRQTSYRPVALEGLPAGARGGLLVAHGLVRRPSPPVCALASGAACPAPGPQRYARRVPRMRSAYRWPQRPARETSPAVAVIPRSTSRDAPSSAPDDLPASPRACRPARTVGRRPPDRVARRGLPMP